METILAQTVLNWVVVSAVSAMSALGLTLVFSILDILNFAQGALYMLGGYAIWYLVGSLGVAYPIGLLLAFVLPGLMGVAIYKGFLRRFRLNVLVCLIITMGIKTLIENGILFGLGPIARSAPPIASGVIKLGNVIVSLDKVVIVISALVAITVVIGFIDRTKVGRAMRAVAEDSEAAALQGVKPENIFSLGMFVGCGIAGIAGALAMPAFTVSPFVGDVPLMNSFIIIVLGGLGSIPGTILGAFILGLIETFGSTFLSVEVASMIGFATLMVILIIRPEGLLGEKA